MKLAVLSILFAVTVACKDTGADNSPKAASAQSDRGEANTFSDELDERYRRMILALPGVTSMEFGKCESTWDELILDELVSAVAPEEYDGLKIEISSREHAKVFVRYTRVFGDFLNVVKGGSTEKIRLCAHLEETITPERLAQLKQQVADFDSTLGSNTLYMSAADHPWRGFYSTKRVDEQFSLPQVKEALDAEDLQVSEWSQETVIDELDFYIEDDPYEDAAMVDRYRRIKEIFIRDFSELRGFEVQRHLSAEIMFYIVGRAQDGYLVGMKVLAVD